MRVIVAGGRDFEDRAYVFETLDRLHALAPFTCVIQGGAEGVDTHARLWAKARGVPCETVKADWETYGRRAGPLRNRVMVKHHRAARLICFPGGKGTRNCVLEAVRAGLPVTSLSPPGYKAFWYGKRKV